VIVITTLLARSIVTFFTIKFRADFWQNFIAKHCYILEQEKTPGFFRQKNIFYRHTFLSLQNEIYSIMLTSHFFRIFPKQLWVSQNWTFINVQNQKSKVPLN
jgi:hypothetical protein